MMKRMKHYLPEERLREPRFSAEKREPGGDLIHVYKYTKGECKMDGARLFSVMHSVRTKGDGHKLKHRMFSPNIRKQFFTMRVLEQWQKLSRELMESLSYVMFKSHVDLVLGNLLYVTLLEHGTR